MPASLVQANFMKIGIQGHLTDLITCVKFVVDRFRGCGVLTSGGSTGGAREAITPPLDWDQNFFITRPKDTHICKPPFACQNVLKLTAI